MAGDTVAQIKDRLSISDVVGQHVKLRRAGRSLVGLCPFHKEKTGSFHVSVDRGTFHCFGCGVGGDAFAFIEKIEGVDFKGALKILAERAGVELDYDPGARENRSRVDRLREAMARAAQWYAGKLSGSEAYAYAKKRGLTDESIKSWGLGFAPNDWRILLEALSQQGFKLEELAAAGLVKEADGKRGTWYDRFRNRLMFPIRDSAGRVVAFTGRALAADEQAKYLNSPETELYHKSDVLFGMDRAKDAIRTRNFTLLVEGQMDLLHAHQAGFGNTVALSGTALTERHLALMKRYSDNLLLALDADSAGLAATAKSAALALKQELKVKVARLPAGKDPADLISEDPKEFTRCIREAKPVVEFFLAVLAEREKDQHRLVGHVERIVLPLLAAIRSPLEREHFVGVVARALGLSNESVRETLVRLPKQQAGETVVRSAPSERPLPETALKMNRELLLRAAVQAYPDSPLAKKIAAEYTRIVEATLPSEEVPEAALFQTEQTFGENPQESAADELLSAFEEAVIREAYQKAVHMLRRAESAGNSEALEEAQALCAKLSTRLAGLRK